jgi:hypothetical protein
VPTNAVILGVTTQMGGSYSQNKGSLNGGTLVYIYGLSQLINKLNQIIKNK